MDDFPQKHSVGSVGTNHRSLAERIPRFSWQFREEKKEKQKV